MERSRLAELAEFGEDMSKFKPSWDIFCFQVKTLYNCAILACFGDLTSVEGQNHDIRGIKPKNSIKTHLSIYSKRD